MKYRFAAIFILLAFLLPQRSAADDNQYYSDRVENAEGWYTSRIENDRDNKMNYFNLASVYKEFGENRKAFELYRDILNINDRETRAHFELAKTYYFLGAYNYAEEEMKYFVRWGITNWEVYFWLGAILQEEGKFEEAEKYYSKALDLDPRRVVTYVKIAEMEKARGRLDEAVEAYKKAVKKDRTYTEEITRKLAVLYEKKGNLAAAFVSWRDANEIDTKDEVAAGKVQRYMAYLPQLKEKQRKYDRAVKEQRKAYTPPDLGPVQGADAVPEVEIGIMEEVNYVYFKCGSDFNVSDDRKKPLFEGRQAKEYFVEADKSGNKAYIGPVDGSSKPVQFKKCVFITRDRPNATTAVYNVQFGEGFYWSGKEDTTYRGDFKAVLHDRTINFVNILNVEEYLYGVVPSEMSPRSGLEALKAQAVSARTYTFRHLNRHRSGGFDLCAQQHCAVYGGVRVENKKTSEAVDETRGEVLFGSDYNMMDTFYSLCCGGHTTNVNDAWGLRSIKSLDGVFDGREKGWSQDWKFPLDPFYLEEWVRSMPDVYCKATGDNETSFRWIRYLDADALEYYVNKRYRVGRVRDLKPLRRSKSGALLKLYIEGDRGKETVNYDPMRFILGKIRSNVIKWEYRRDAKGYIRDIYIYGAGWGHGIGMCQQGAENMAALDKAYTEILYHYFPGSYIKKKY
jgi:stage II sporulation protein D